MKLRNKKTGEIREVREILIDGMFKVASLAELNEEWEDYGEPKGGYIIDPMEEDYVSLDDSGFEESDVERAKELGIWFETKEEVEKAVEKLKAWKRLKDNGFEFTGWDRHPDFSGDFRITASDQWACDDKDLDLLFGGEE